MEKIIPDTNFLIYLSKYKLLDNLKEYKILLIKGVLEELKGISINKKKKLADRDAASLILQFFDKIKERIEFLDYCEKNTDDLILKVSLKEKCLVGTMDKELIKKLKRNNLGVLIIKQKKIIREI